MFYKFVAIKGNGYHEYIHVKAFNLLFTCFLSTDHSRIPSNRPHLELLLKLNDVSNNINVNNYIVNYSCTCVPPDLPYYT